MAFRRAREVDRAVGVGGGAALADGDDERVAHVVVETEARELGGRHRLGGEVRADEPGERGGDALGRDRGGALTDGDDAADRTGADAVAEVLREGLGTEHHAELAAVGLDDPAAERLAERRR